MILRHSDVYIDPSFGPSTASCATQWINMEKMHSKHALSTESDRISLRRSVSDSFIHELHHRKDTSPDGARISSPQDDETDEIATGSWLGCGFRCICSSCRWLALCLLWTFVVGAVTLAIPLVLNRLDAALTPAGSSEYDVDALSLGREGIRAREVGLVGSESVASSSSIPRSTVSGGVTYAGKGPIVIDPAAGRSDQQGLSAGGQITPPRVPDR